MGFVKVAACLDVELGAEYNTSSLMDGGGHKIEDVVVAVDASASGTLDHVGERDALVQNSQFALWRRVVSWVQEDTAVQQGPVHVAHHRPDVAQRVWTPLRWVLHGVDVLLHRWVPLLLVAFVDRVHIEGVLDPNVRVSQDEITQVVSLGVAINLIVESEHKEGCVAVDAVARS